MKESFEPSGQPIEFHDENNDSSTRRFVQNLKS